MTRIARAVLVGMAAAGLIASLPGVTNGDSDAESRRHPPRPGTLPDDVVSFSSPVFVDPPKVLLGDSGDPRCPDASAPCLKDVDDLLFGRTHLLRRDDFALGYQGGRALALTQDSTIPNQGVGTQTLNDGSGQYSQKTVVVGARPFQIASDVAVSFFMNSTHPPGTSGPPNALEWRLEGLGAGSVASGMVQMPYNIPITPSPDLGNGGFSSLAADFTGDGLDEIVVMIGAAGFSGIPNEPVLVAVVATAVDPQDPSKGLRFGPVLWNCCEILPPLKIAKVTVAGRPRVFTAQGLPTDLPVCGDLNAPGLSFHSYLVDPQTLALSDTGMFHADLPEGDAQCLRFVDMTSGRFSTSAHDQLLVTYGFVGRTIKILPFDFEQGLAVPKAIYDTGLQSGGGASFIRSGRFDWTSPLDQAALLVSNDFNAPGINTLRILSFDSNFNTTAGPVFQAGTANECVNDMVVGNFDRTQPNPTPPPATLANPNLQVAIPFTDCQRTIALRIYDVDPVTSQISRPPNSELNIQLPSSLFRSTLAAVDLQGRSLRVGVPDVVTIDKRQQASLILATPPMHVDAVVPVSGGHLRPYNMTGAPDGFRAGFTFSGTTNNNSDTTTGLTASFTAKQTVEDKATFGDCDLGVCASVDVKLSAQQALESSKQSLAGQFASSSVDVTGSTGFSDLISFKSDHFTIFAYPVVGQRVCPSDKPNCAPSEELPLTFTMAGPDTVSFKELESGTAYSWYQPPWMPGNILSYPGNLDQLKAGLADLTGFKSLSQANAWLTTSGGSSNARATWTQGGTTGTTTNSVQNYSFDGSISVSGQVGLEDLVGDQQDIGVDLGGSRGFSTLTDSSKTVSASQGIEFTRTAQFTTGSNAGDYGYEVTPQIFGQEQPTNPIDDETTPADVQTYGALRTAHMVSVPDGSGGEDFGSFWSTTWYKSASDVALHQPLHWTIDELGSDPGNGSCRLFQNDSSNVDCVALGTRLPSTPGSKPIYQSDFHHMRGLFVTGSSGGPQLTTATTGDPLRLQARVYNLSLAPLPTGSSLHVRFMAMPWNVGTNDPAGPSFQIGADQPIPGNQLPAFNTDTPHPNWILVPQTFDTGSMANPNACGGRSCDNLDLMFWVVVWIQNGDALVGEIQQHGLTSIPAAGEDFLDVAAREQTYSNNLGFYTQPFHFFPQATAPQAPTPPEGEIGAQLTQVGTAHRLLRRGQPTVLAAKVQTGGQALQGGLVVDFYDGDPAADGELIGSRYLPHLLADRTHDFRVPFRTQECGRHDIFIVAGADTRHEHTAMLRPILVLGEDCRAGGRPDQIGRAENVGSGSAIGRVRFEAEAASQGELDLRKATLTVRSVLTEGGGAGELLRDASGAVVLPQTLTARRDSRRDWDWRRDWKGSEVVFESRQGAGPKLRVEVETRDRKPGVTEGGVEVELEAEMGTLAAPQLCAANAGHTVLLTELTLDDGVNPAHVFEWVLPWRCEGSRLSTL